MCGMSQTLACVVRVQKILARAKENGRAEILVWMKHDDFYLRLCEVLLVILVSLFPKIKTSYQYVKSY